MPLSEKVKFVARLQKGNRVQIPKHIRWRFKLEIWQALKITANGYNYGATTKNSTAK